MIASAGPLLTSDHVEEIAQRAWLNVAPHSREYAPLALLTSLSDLEGLAETSVQYRADVQYVLSEEVAMFLAAAQRILARLAQTTSLVTHEGRIPLGVVNWPATYARRLTAGNDGLGFVLRRNEVHRDLPENRLLRALLLDVAQRANSILPTARKGQSAWLDRVETTHLQASRLAHHPLLAPVPARFSTEGMRAAMSSRIPGYREVARAYALFVSLYRENDRNQLIQLFREAVLLPEKEDRRFELLLLFRLLQHLEDRGAVRRHFRLIGRPEGGDGPIFSYAYGDATIDVHFQGMPAYLAERSLYAKMGEESAFGRSLRRPDIIVTVARPAAPLRLFLFEAKCTLSTDTIRDGIFQVLGYSGDLKLHLESSPVLAVVAFAAERYPKWPTPFLINGYAGTVTDLSGFAMTLDALDVLGGAAAPST